MAETNQTQREEELARREALLAQREAQLEKEQAELAAAKAQSTERKKTLLDNNDPNFVNPKEKLYDKFPLTVHQMDIIIGVLFALILLFLARRWHFSCCWKACGKQLTAGRISG